MNDSGSGVGASTGDLAHSFLHHAKHHLGSPLILFVPMPEPAIDCTTPREQLAFVCQSGRVIRSAGHLNHLLPLQPVRDGQGFAVLGDGRAVAQLTIVAFSPRVDDALVVQNGRVKITAGDLDDFVFQSLNLLRFELVLLVRMAQLAISAIAPRKDQSGLCDGRGVPRGTGNLCDMMLGQSLHDCGYQTVLFVTMTQLTFFVSAPSKNTTTIGDGRRGDIATVKIKDEFVCQCFYDLGGSDHGRVAVAEPPVVALAPHEQLAIFSECARVKVTACHSYNTNALELGDDGWRKAMALLSMTQSSKTASAPRAHLPTGVQRSGVGGTTGHGADLLPEETLHDSWIELIILIAMTQSTVHAVAPRVDVIAVFAFGDDCLPASEGNRESLVLCSRADHAGWDLRYGTASLGINGKRLETRNPCVKL